MTTEGELQYAEHLRNPYRIGEKLVRIKTMQRCEVLAVRDGTYDILNEDGTEDNDIVWHWLQRRGVPRKAEARRLLAELLETEDSGPHPLKLLAKKALAALNGVPWDEK